MAKLLFWVAVGFPVYVYFGYPALLWCLQAISSIFRSSANKQTAFKEDLPSVSLLVAAYNEAAVIADKIRNSLALDYPSDKLEIVVASDGSKDSTAKIAQSFAGPENDGRVRVLDYEKNRGKTAALNASVPQLRGEIVAFTDASSMLAKDSIRTLVQHFRDPRIGVACGVYRLLKNDEAPIGPQEGLYWKYETFIKIQEVKLGAFTGAHGALYAIRGALYPFPPEGTINDDFTIPMRIVQHGYRVAYEPGAAAYEEAHEMEGFSRRVRITAGNIEQLREIKRLLWPPRLFVLLCLLSHKTGRLLVPLFMLIAFAANVVLWNQFPYNWLLAGQLLFYGLAILETKFKLRPKILGLPYYFCMINSALFAWIYQALRHRRVIPSRMQLDQLGNDPPST